MSDLIAITFDNTTEASEARAKFQTMEAEHLVELEDSAIVYKDEKGEVRVLQAFDPAGEGAVLGAFWGLIVGYAFSIPLGDPYMLPFATGVLGASLGAAAGYLSDHRIDYRMMRSLGRQIDQGKAALFILVRKQTTERVLEALSGTSGSILKTSLPRALEERYARALRPTGPLRTRTDSMEPATAV